MTDTTQDLAVKVVAEPFDDFDGEPVTEARLSFSGELPLHRPIHRGGKVIIVTEVEVNGVAHKAGDGGQRRDHATLKAHAYELPGRVGRRTLTAAKVAERMAADGVDGRTAIEGFLEAEGEAEGLEVTTDGSGVVLTNDELAELGLGEETDPVMVVLFGGQRLVWPDDFPTGTPRPAAGDFVTDSDGDDAQVHELVDMVTGETVATWTDADEDARLLALEQAAEAEEAGEALTDGQLANRAPWPGYDGQPAKAVVSHLTTEVDDPAVADHVAVYEAVHKNRESVVKAAVARSGSLARRAAEPEPVVADDLPPLPDDDTDREG